MKTYLFLLSFILIFTSYGQDTTQTQISNLQSELDSIKNIMKKYGDKSDFIDVGKLRLKSFTVPMYTKSDTSSISIDSILIITKNGCIVDIQVLCPGDIVFTNHLAPIEVSERRIEEDDRLYGNNENYLIMSDLFIYISLKPYIPEDDSFILKPTQNTYTFSKGVGLNSIFDLRVYTDALGLLGGKANGLIQTDASFKQILHRSNFSDLGIFAFNYFKFNLTASKFDSKVGYTDSSAFTRTSLLQKSWLNADISIGILNGWLSKKSLSSYYADFGVGVNLSNVAKSVDTTTVTSTYIFLQPGFDFKLSDNIGSSFSTRFIWSYSPQTDFNNQAGEELFIKPSFGIFWNPLGNQASRIFARLTYTVNPNDKKSNFFQVQLGYSVLLTSLMKDK